MRNRRRRRRRRRDISLQFRLCAVEMRSNEEGKRAWRGEMKWRREILRQGTVLYSCSQQSSSQMHTTNPSSLPLPLPVSSRLLRPVLPLSSISPCLSSPHLPLCLFTHSFRHLPFCLFVCLLLYPCLDRLSRPASSSSVNRIYRILPSLSFFSSSIHSHLLLSTSLSGFFVKWFDACAVCIRESVRAIPHTNSSSSKSSSQQIDRPIDRRNNPFSERNCRRKCGSTTTWSHTIGHQKCHSKCVSRGKFKLISYRQSASCRSRTPLKFDAIIQRVRVGQIRVVRF